MAFGRRPSPPRAPGSRPSGMDAPIASPPLQPALPSDGDAAADDLGSCPAAARELIEMLKENYLHRDDRIHAETIIGGAAALTGEFALRSLGTALPSSGFVFGDPINDILFEGAGRGRATLWDVLATVAMGAGVPDRDLPDVNDILNRVAARVAHMVDTGDDGGGFPPITVPRENYPHEWSPNACPRLRDKVTAIGQRRALTPRQLAFAMAMATAGLMTQTKAVLAPPIAVRLAAEIMFSTAKMAPLAAPVV